MEKIKANPGIPKKTGNFKYEAWVENHVKSAGKNAFKLTSLNLNKILKVSKLKQ